MEIIQDNSPTFKIKCLRCGSILSAKEGDIITNMIENLSYKSKIHWTSEYFIPQCPCCKVINPKIEIIKDGTDN